MPDYHQINQNDLRLAVGLHDNEAPNTGAQDQLLAQLRRVHRAPRYDIPARLANSVKLQELMREHASTGRRKQNAKS